MQIFAKAMGVSEQEMIKMVESGNILATDILPKVAVEFQKAANASGALEQKYKTTRIAQGRFFKELETSQKKVFKQGFDESMANLLNTLAEELNASETGMRGLAKTFRLVFNTIANVAKVVMPVLNDLSTAIGAIADGFNAVFGSKLGKWVLGIGIMAGAMYKLSQAANLVYLRIAAILGIITELVALFTSGYAGGIEAALGVDINLTKIPVIADLYKMSKEDSPMGRFVDAILSVVTVLLSIMIPLRLMGVKFTIMWKQISKLADKIKSAAGGGKDVSKKTPKQSRFDFKARKPFGLGEKIDSSVRGGMSKGGFLRGGIYGLSATQLMSMWSDMWEAENLFSKSLAVNSILPAGTSQAVLAAQYASGKTTDNRTIIEGDINPTIHIPSGEPDVIKRTMDDWFNSITINNAAVGG